MTTNVQSSTWVADSRPPMMRLWVLLLALPILGAIAFAVFQPIQVLPRIAPAPGFSFVDQDGNQLTSDDLRGSLVLYNFTYTRCADPCPQTSAYLKQIEADLRSLDLGDIPLRFVTISFDPTHDTPDALRDYAASLGADTATWHFVTGEERQLKQVIGAGFSTYYGPDDQGGFEFTPAFALVDGLGILRATYRTATPDLATLKRDINLILTEARNSSGVNRYAYEAAHLFLCYPR